MAALNANQPPGTDLTDDLMLIVTGSPADGFKYIGPFPTPDDAGTYARDNVRDSWWLYPLSRPRVS